jgi:membrane-associated phospholipid phosphatase
MDKHTDRIVPLAFTSVYYYLGYFLIGKIYIYPVFKVFLIASVLVIIALLLISFKWKISNHLAAIGGFTGTIIALSYRMGMNPVMIIISTIIVAGLVGSARIYLEKHSLPQVLAGFALGLIVLYLAVLFV